jgi:hypothetical protein
MLISQDRLRTALSLIQRNEENGMWFSSSTFGNFSSDVWQSSFSNRIDDAALKTRLAKTSGYLYRTKHDLDILLTICSQANWQKNMVLGGHLDTFDNLRYGIVLVDAFLTRYRSTYDTIAKTFREIAKYPKEAPQSFSDLRNPDQKENILRLFGNDLADLLKCCDWYDQITCVRDEVVHRNAITSGFMASRILFQVSKRFKNKINFPEVMANENLVDFELYVAVHIGYTLWFLEEFAKILYPILSPLKLDSNPQSYHDGFGILRQWIVQVLSLPTN